MRLSLAKMTFFPHMTYCYGIWLKMDVSQAVSLIGVLLSGAWGLALTLPPSPSAQEDHLSTAKAASAHETYFTIS